MQETQEMQVQPLGWEDPLKQDPSILAGFPGGSDGKKSTCNAGDLGSIPGSEGSLEKGMAAHSGILAWENPMNRGPDGLQSVGSQELNMTERLSTCTRDNLCCWEEKTLR